MVRSISGKRGMIPLFGMAVVATLSLSTQAAARDGASAAPCGGASAEQPKKKKGLGLGGLMSAAKNAGVGRILGSGMLGGSVKSQVAGAVAGTAINAASGSAGAANAAQVVYGGSAASQVAGAVTGTAINAAAAGAQQAAMAGVQQASAGATNCVVSGAPVSTGALP